MLRKTFVAAFVVTSAAIFVSLGLGRAAAHGARTQRLAGTIAFLRDSGGPDGSKNFLYVVHPDGSGLKRVTPPATPVLRYAWSPSGRLVAYIDSVRHSLWLIRRDGTQLRRLLSGSKLASEGLGWSPDGTKIAITSQGPYAKTTTGTCPGPRIYVVPIHSSQPRLVRGTRNACGDPAWSPNGDQIAYDGYGSGVWVIRPNGSDRRRVSRRGFGWVRWSADGRRLAFSVRASKSSYGGPAVVDADGRSFHVVTTKGYTEYPAEWSPQGRRILYGRVDHGGIYVIGADGKHDVRVTSDWPQESVWPALAWAPDGMSIVYARHTGHGDLYVVGADGHGKVQLTSSPGGSLAPSWVAGAGTEKTASVAPTCSAWNNRNERTIHKGGWERYCGPGRAVLRLDGKVFRIKHGTCHRTPYSVGFGLIGYGDKFPDGRGMDLHLSRVGHLDLDGPIRAGRNSVFDGEVQLPGYGSLPHTGHAIIAKHLKGGTFSLGSRANRVTGRFPAARNGSADPRRGQCSGLTPERAQSDIRARLNAGMRLGLLHPATMLVLQRVRAAAALLLAVGFVLVVGEPAGAVMGRRPLLAAFGARSYRPGQVAVLRIDSSPVQRLTLRLFLVGGAATGAVPPDDRDLLTFGQAVTEQLQVRRPVGRGAWPVHIHLRSDWPSGIYVAHLSGPGISDYAPFVLRPRRLGSARVLVVEPTNTWQAYNVTGRDSWYLDPAVHRIDLTRPYAGVNVRGRPIPKGLPDQFFRLGLGFLRWYWRSCYRADFVSDDDLERVAAVATLRHYRLIVFAGHEEYVTSHVYDLIERYRDEGGSLAFLSANNFFYKVDVSGDTMTGRTRWRDLGRPEAALVGAQYVGWNDSRVRPYRVLDTRTARWLFAGTGLHYGSRFGDYGIEIDHRSAASPPNTHVLAAIRNFGVGKTAEMTIYRRGHATVFDAGVLNFAASANWPQISQFVSNLWSHLSGVPRQEQPTCS